MNTQSGRSVLSVVDDHAAIPEVDDNVEYLEQFCTSCREETDQLMTRGSSTVTCVLCDSSNSVQPEDARLTEFLDRVTEDETATIESWRGQTAEAPDLPIVGI